MDKEAIIKNIEKTFLEKKNSHAFLFETNNITKCYEDVLNIIKVITNHEYDNLIDNNYFPDLISVEPDGKEIKVFQIENIIDTFSTTSIMGSYSIYIIKEAEKLNLSSANKILKFLEEPEKNIVGFFITSSVSKILPTIKSRCELFKINYKFEDIKDVLSITEEQYKYFEETMDFAFKLNSTKKYILMNHVKQIAKKERFEIETILDILRKAYIIKYDYLLNRLNCDKSLIEQILVSVDINDIKILAKRITLIEQIQGEFKFNLNKELILNKMILMWE